MQRQSIYIPNCAAMGNNILNMYNYDDDKNVSYHKNNVSYHKNNASYHIGKQLLALQAKPHGQRYSAESNESD